MCVYALIFAHGFVREHCGSVWGQHTGKPSHLLCVCVCMCARAELMSASFILEGNIYVFHKLWGKHLSAQPWHSPSCVSNEPHVCILCANVYFTLVWVCVHANWIPFIYFLNRGPVYDIGTQVSLPAWQMLVLTPLDCSLLIMWAHVRHPAAAAVMD